MYMVVWTGHGGSSLLIHSGGANRCSELPHKTWRWKHYSLWVAWVWSPLGSTVHLVINFCNNWFLTLSLGQLMHNCHVYSFKNQVEKNEGYHSVILWKTPTTHWENFRRNALSILKSLMSLCKNHLEKMKRQSYTYVDIASLKTFQWEILIKLIKKKSTMWWLNQYTFIGVLPLNLANL
jgi:hypothetical protein